MSTPVQNKLPAHKRPVCIRVMPPLVPGAVIDSEGALLLLIAHMNEAPLTAAAGGATEPSSKECAKPVKCTTKKFSSSKECAEPPQEGYTRLWNKEEELGWSFIDWDNSQFQFPNSMYPLLK